MSFTTHLLAEHCVEKSVERTEAQINEYTPPKYEYPTHVTNFWRTIRQEVEKKIRNFLKDLEETSPTADDTHSAKVGKRFPSLTHSSFRSFMPTFIHSLVFH